MGHRKMAGLEASRALEKCEKGVQENAKTLKESSLTAQCYHKIRRLHDDKISSKGIAAEVTSLQQPHTRSIFMLYVCNVRHSHGRLACLLRACLSYVCVCVCVRVCVSV